MNVQAGATVGFLTALGGLSGAIFGSMVGGLLETKGSSAEKMVAYGAGAGALVGAFIGGTVIAPAATTTTPTAAATPLLPASTAQNYP